MTAQITTTDQKNQAEAWLEKKLRQILTTRPELQGFKIQADPLALEHEDDVMFTCEVSGANSENSFES